MQVTKMFEGGVVILGFFESMNIQLTFNVEIGLACVLLFSCSVFGSDALEGAGVQGSVDDSELQVSSLLKTPLWVEDGLPVVKPAVGDATWIIHFTPQHGTASVQCILGFGLLCEVEGSRVHTKHWGKRRAGRHHNRPRNNVRRFTL